MGEKILGHVPIVTILQKILGYSSGGFFKRAGVAGCTLQQFLSSVLLTKPRIESGRSIYIKSLSP